MLSWPGRLASIVTLASLASSMSPATASADEPPAGQPATAAASPAAPETRAGQPAAAAGPVAPEATTAPSPIPHSGNTARTIGWISIAVGGEAAIIAITTSSMILYEKDARDAACSAQKVCSQKGVDANATLDTLLAWNATSWIVAAAGLGLGTVLLLTNPKDSARRVALTVTPSPGGGAIALTGQF